MMVQMLAGWERQKPAAETRGQSGSPRNSKDLLSIGGHVVENKNKKLLIFGISDALFRLSSRLGFFGYLKKREGEAVTVEVGNNLVAIRNLRQVTLSYCIFGEYL